MFAFFSSGCTIFVRCSSSIGTGLAESSIERAREKERYTASEKQNQHTHHAPLVFQTRTDNANRCAEALRCPCFPLTHCCYMLNHTALHHRAAPP